MGEDLLECMRGVLTMIALIILPSLLLSRIWFVVLRAVPDADSSVA